jgi:hypothetical protein
MSILCMSETRQYVVFVKFSKSESGKRWEKRWDLFTNARRARLRQPEPDYHLQCLTRHY